jgi:hypothetical protein
MLYDIYIGVGNIFRWSPVIFFDRDFDWAFLAHIMHYKLTRMAKLFEKYGHHVNKARDVRNMRVCVALLKRMMDDNYDCGFNHKDFKGYKRDQEYLGKVLGKHFQSWWD